MKNRSILLGIINDFFGNPFLRIIVIFSELKWIANIN